MTAICKTIPIHGNSTSPLLKYCADDDKTSVSKNKDSVAALLDYGANPLKTICNIDEDHKELLISGIKCSPETAAEEFELTKQKYLAIKGTSEEFDKHYDASKGKKKRQPMIAIHLIQSFAEEDIDPRVAHEIGVRLAESFGCQAVVDTHMNKKHIHNHIILNSYMENGRKMHCNKEFILSTRELSNEIQKEFGIPNEFDNPRDQLYHKEKGTINRKEWEVSNEGLSWKDQMRYDIATISEMARDREEYLSIMEAYGYQVEKENPKNITFRVKSNDRKISDKSLGMEYTVGALFPLNKEVDKDEYVKETHKRYNSSPFMGKPISIARYDINGRRRGFLEMLLRKAIAIIQRVGNFFFDERYNYKKSNHQSAKYKINLLNEAIDLVQKYDVDGNNDLEEKIRETAVNLSHAKRNLRISEIQKDLIETIDTAIADIEVLSMVKTTVGELHLHEYSIEDVRKNKAKIASMTSKQKKDLSRELAKNEDYRLICRFDELSCSDAEDLLKFFNDKTNKRPEVLLTKEEFEAENTKKQMESVYERQVYNLKNKYENIKPSEKQIQQIEKILNNRGISVDTSSLSQFDIINIRNCFSDNPFKPPLISEKQKNLLDSKLKELNLESNRDTKYITANEMNHFMRYIEGKTKLLPDFLGLKEFPPKSDIHRLKSFMKAKNIHSIVPVDLLNKKDFNKLYSFVIHSGHIPEILQPLETESNIEKDNMFFARISKYNVSRSLHLSQLRNDYNTLRSLGFDVKYGDDLSYIKDMVKEWKESFSVISKDKEELSQKYADLIKVKQATKYAKSKAFLYGDLFNDEIDKEIEVKEVDEKDTRSEEEDRKQRRKEKEEELDI